MSSHDPIFVGKGDREAHLLPAMANRHGLIAGATGTGKTVTLQRLAEQFSRRGVPVFMADVKGDLSGIARPGQDSPKLNERLQRLGLGDFSFRGCPVVFWDLFGTDGHPIRATVSEMGPLLLARLLNLNETQSGVLQLVFRIADDHGLLLLDLKDLRAVLQYVGEKAREFTLQYGNVSAASIGAIQRGLLALESQGGEHFFAEPALNFADLLQSDGDGAGVVNILSAVRLVQAPRLYATFLLYLLSELFENLPEVGDVEKPRLVFFFDEAHLLFGDIPPVVLEKIEQVVRLIRSKGVGIYFITQNPADIPETVLGQLGNRVQHALRAYTPKEQKAVRTAAQTFRPNPAFSCEAVITELAVGEALVSLLDERGTPAMVERVWICPPESRIGPLDQAERRRIVQDSPLQGVYDTVDDRESAFEKLKNRAITRSVPAAPVEKRAGGRASDTLLETMAKSAVRSLGSSVGRQLVRGVLGSLFGGGRRR